MSTDPTQIRLAIETLSTLAPSVSLYQIPPADFPAWTDALDAFDGRVTIHRYTNGGHTAYLSVSRDGVFWNASSNIPAAPADLELVWRKHPEEDFEVAEPTRDQLDYLADQPSPNPTSGDPA